MSTIRFPSNRALLPAALLLCFALFSLPARAADLRVMKTGLGSGTITAPGTINCGTSCDAAFTTAASVILTATASAGSTFAGWQGDCAGTALTCNLVMSAGRSVRAEFSVAIPPLATFTPAGIQAYLTANPTVNSAPRFLKALPDEYKRNWILMSRSESLQTGTAESPRILLPGVDARNVFTVGMATHSSYPGAHPSAIEYMQWDPAEKNFRFHEIVLDNIPAMGSVSTRTRGVSVDDAKCSKCHSTRNVLNRGSSPGTDGIPPGTVKVKNKPNWDAYDSWGGMMPFNRDRIYQGSLEAAAFRKIFNPWTWRANDLVRSILEQLELQPPGVTPAHAITRTNAGPNDGHVDFGFDVSPPVLTPEVAPTGPPTTAVTYGFNGVAGTPPATDVTRGGTFLTLHYSTNPTSDEGRGVRLFDTLGGLAGNLNPQRIADELINHRFATGSVPIDVKPLALAIAKGCLVIDAGSNTVTSTPPHAINLAFFTARNGGMAINDVVADTRSRTQSVPRRKVDIEKLNLDRTGDPYLFGAVNGLIQQFGLGASPGLDTSLARIRQEIFRRPVDLGSPDATVMGGLFVDRELYSSNTNKMALFRYFLEPLGVSVDKWSMGVRGRSRTYSFADVFGSYIDEFQVELNASLGSPDCGSLVSSINANLSSLPAATAVPPFTDVQRIFNKGCIECHGGLGYPPYYSTGTFDLSEDEAPAVGVNRLTRPFDQATSFTTSDPATSYLYQRITATSEGCPGGLMPCGGPPLSKVDVETIRRWIVGGRPNTAGDPHIKTVDGINYDFQSAGEFVLLKGEDLEIQARQSPVSTEAPLGPNEHTGLTSCVSLNTAVAIRLGSHRITYEPNLSGQPDPSGLQLRIDGKLTRIAARGILLPGGIRITRTTAPGGIQIESPSGTAVVVTPGWWSTYQLWYMNIDVTHARATEGVMGAVAPGNWLPGLPDGAPLGAKPAGLGQRFKILYGVFANAWRVNDKTSLFDYPPGASTKTFTLAGWPEESPRSCRVPQIEGIPARPPQKALPKEEAERRCGAIVAADRKANCIQDVMVTGEAEFAKTYLLTEQIEGKAPPVPPVPLRPEDNRENLAGDVTFDWKPATGLNGGTLVHKVCVWEAGQPFAFESCQSAPQEEGSLRGTAYAGLVALAGLVLLIILIFFEVGRGPMRLVALAVVAALLVAFLMGRSRPATATVVALEPGTPYLWKVIAESATGDHVESETHRFTIK